MDHFRGPWKMLVLSLKFNFFRGAQNCIKMCPRRYDLDHFGATSGKSCFQTQKFEEVCWCSRMLLASSQKAFWILFGSFLEAFRLLEGVLRIVLKSAPGGTIWTISGERLENARFQPQIPFLSGVPRIVLKCTPGATIWTISGEHLENHVFEPKIEFFSGCLEL